MAGKLSKKLLSEFERLGLLLMSDAKFPSVVTIAAGKPVRGSWWGSPSGELIYEQGNALGDHPDALLTKLVSGKVTFVHRRLWPTVHAVGTGRATWQMTPLSQTARKVLAEVDRQKLIQTDWMIEVGGFWSKDLSAATTQLEKALLVYSEQVHTDKGKHAKRLELWPGWAKRVGFTPTRLSLSQAQEQLEQAVAAVNAEFKSSGKLPWQ